jgi:hypothetical protein
MNRKIILFMIFSMFGPVNMSAQQFTIGVKLSGISIHPKGSYNVHLQRFNLDKKGIFVLNPGISLGFEYFLYKDILSIKFVQMLYADCCAQFAGFTHIGARHKIFSNENHLINGGIGPTFVYRRSWYKLDGYIDDFVFFKGGPEDKWQWRFIWYGGEMEYNYSVNGETNLSLSIIPALPALIQLSIGAGLNGY